MNCIEVMEHVSSMVDNRLSGTELDEFNRHLKLCKRCQNEYKLEKVTKIFLQSSLRPYPPPPYLEQKVLTYINNNLNSKNFFAGIVTFIRLMVKRWYLTAGFAGAVILIFILIQGPSSHSHDSPRDNNLIHLIYNNYDAVIKGRMASFIQANNNYGLAIPKLNDCSLVGGCVTSEKGQQVTHTIYQKENCIIYYLQINFDSIKNNPNLTLPSHVFEEIKETGMYIADMNKCCSVILKVKENTLVAVAAEMDKTNLLAYLNDTESK